MRAWLPSVALGAGLAVQTACGPSFQAIYEGDAHFEHCYAMDDDPSAPLQSKTDCWSDWARRYTYGQTRDRVEYATMRYRALSRVPGAPTDEAMMGAAPGEGKTSSNLTAPAPTSAFAPPPKTEEVAAVGGAAPDASAPASSSPQVAVDAGKVSAPPPPPKAICVDGCASAWQGCKLACANTAAGCPACDRTYGKCVKGCF
jgi:hypothetical protein